MADPFTIGLAMSIHIGLHDRDEFNEVHPYAEYAINRTDSVGVMYNSQHRISTYVKTNVEYTESYSVDYGLVTGYERVFLVPMVRTTYTYSDNFSVWAMPGFHVDDAGKDSAGVVIGVQFKF